MINFKNKKILITGATGGIGKALVKKFVSLEGSVLATGTKTEKLEALKKEFSNINILKFDISDHSKIEEFVENVSSQLSGLDVLVNNAGISASSPDLLDIDIFDNVMKVNTRGVFLGMKYCLGVMLEGGGGSVCGLFSCWLHPQRLSNGNRMARP